jgi:SOS-response transcriptional repressor LexA
MPKPNRRPNRISIDAASLKVASAGPGRKSPKIPPLIAIPVLQVVAASHGEKGDSSSVLHNAPVESMIAAPRDWCPNPSATTCVRVKGNSMSPLIYDGYVMAIDTSQTDHAKLAGKIVIAWHKDMGLTVSRLQRYDHTEVLRPENSEYSAIVLDSKHQWKVLAKVLWWIGRAP